MTQYPEVLATRLYTVEGTYEVLRGKALKSCSVYRLYKGFYVGGKFMSLFW